MKVALLLCPSWDSTYPAVSLALLAALLKKEGHEAEILDLNHQVALLERASAAILRPPSSLLTFYGSGSKLIDRSSVESCGGWLKSTADRLASGDTRLVGFSTYSSNLEASYAVAKLLKARRPDMKIVFGGPSCTSMMEGLKHLKQDCVDAVVRGEAELTFPRLVEAFARSGRLEAGPGVMLREDASTWKDVPPDVIEDLDGLPYADYGAYGSLDTYGGKVINTARGCVRKCVYCSDWRDMSYRSMSGRRIFDELAHQLRLHPHKGFFLFGDAILNSRMKELEAFCDLVIAERLPVTWGGNAIVRPEMTPRFLAKMRAAGCCGLYYGVESGSGRVLKKMRKGVQPALNARVLRDTRGAGIETTAMWIVGFPTETEEAFRESLDFVAANAASIGLLSISLFSIESMHAMTNEFDIPSNADDRYWATRDGKNTFPVRLSRLRRLIETARESGVDNCVHSTSKGAVHLPQLVEYERRALESYESR